MLKGFHSVETGSTMSDVAKDKAARLLKKRGSISSLSSHEVKAKETTGKTKDSVSTVSYIDEPGHHDDIPRPAVQMENTYQIGPIKRFPVATVNNILKDVLTSYLQEEKYEAELCRQMTKTISEVIKARVKDLMIPRYKIIVLITIGQLNDQNMRIGSRCLWDPTNDTFSSYAFKNNSLFAVANVYAVYFE
ncbi:dynein light chain Tctex-type 5 [Lepisosteus oculatus]|uniref:Dynein light chain Tctex-type family member 5 n=1 Tax=Lepisosteus oculatus TaxID=7918 RepID=W5MJ79_LEPOC|nr:PREDICTED: tctex1 domain-containing protein 1 [Lepisosteus oculatus]